MEYEILRRVIAEVLGIDEKEIYPDSAIAKDLGADSIQRFAIIARLEEEFDLEVDEEYALEVVTVEDALNLLRDTIAS